MNIRAAAENLLSYLSPDERAIPESSMFNGRHAAVITAVNGALQELYGEGQPWMRKETRGVLYHAPASNIPITVTNGSATATIAEDDWQDWFEGCTVAISGSSIDNEIRYATGTTTRTLTLLFPHEGPSGVAAATIVHDSIDFPSDVLAISSQVKTGDGHFIAPVNGPDAFSLRVSDDDYERHLNGLSQILPRARKSEVADVPLIYHVVSHFEDAYAEPVYRLRLYPAPKAATSVSFRAIIKPPSFVTADITADPPKNIPIPHNHAETIFLPIAVQRFTACPFFRNDAVMPEMNRQYREALRLAQSANPQRNGSKRLVPKY